MLVYAKSDTGVFATPVDIHYNKDSFNEIELLFNKLKNNGFITERTVISDNRWVVVQNKIESSLTFDFNELDVRRACDNSDILISYEDFILAVKHFTLINLQNNNPLSCSSAINSIRNNLASIGFMNNIDKFNKEKVKIKKQKQLSRLTVYADFIEFITTKPISNEIQEEMLLLEDYVECESNTRVLPTFRSIFEFGDIMSSFVYNATEEKLLKYGPLVLWWYIGNRIPLRPYELILIERECVHKNNDKYYLDIKRNIGKGKGSSIKLINNFDLRDTYVTETVQTDEKIYNAICSYNNLVEKYFPEEKERELLFSKKARDSFLRYTVKRDDCLNQNILTPKNLSVLLNEFYIEIVEGQYGIKSHMRDYENSKGKSRINLNENPIHEKLVLYDLRHLAIINLILLGKEPLGVMKMAGHSQMSTTMGYYNHIEEFSKSFSITYAKHLRALKNHDFDSLSEGTSINLNNILESTAPTNKALQTWKQITTSCTENKQLKKVDGGFCSYKNKDFSPCFAVDGIHSICPYFINDDESIMEDELTKLNNTIDSAIETIKYLVNNYDKISDFSQKYSIKTEELKNTVISASKVAARLSSIDTATRILKPLESKLEE